jgi:hypothetical protein
MKKTSKSLKRSIAQEQREHPWATRKQAERIAKDHAKR